MEWWIWLVLACALGIAEMIIPLDFYLLFLGGSALTVGLVTASLEPVGVAPQAGWQWLLFALIAPILLVFGRGLAWRYIHGSDPSAAGHDIEDQEIEVQDRIAVGETGRGLAKGTSWTIRNLGEKTLEAGDRCQVLSRDGLTLSVGDAVQHSKEKLWKP